MVARKRTLQTLLVLAALTALPAIQEGRAYQISGPNLGYVADALTSTVRVINGIPGAAAIGRPARVDVKIRRAQVSVERDYALAVNDVTGELLLITNLSGDTSMLPVSGAVHGGDALALSPDGASGAAYSMSNTRIQVIEGLPWDPVVRFEFDTAGMGQELTALAVSDNQQVLAAFSNGETGALYMAAPETAPRPISAAGSVSGIAFAAGSDRAVIADRVSNDVVLLENLSAATPIRLAGSSDGISKPLGVLLSRDAARAFVANEESRTVTVIHLRGGATRNVPCHCQPVTMRPLRGDSIFALTDRTDEPIVVFEGQSTDYRILFVPAKSRDASNSGGHRPPLQ